MSLEQAIQDNTAAIRALTEIIQKGMAASPGRATPGQDEATPAKKPAAKPVESVKAPADVATTTTESPVTGKTDSAPASAPAPTVTLDDLKKAFLALVAKNREAAVGILSARGLSKLTEAKTDQYEAIAAEIAKASA